MQPELLAAAEAILFASGDAISRNGALVHAEIGAAMLPLAADFHKGARFKKLFQASQRLFIA